MTGAPARMSRLYDAAGAKSNAKRRMVRNFAQPIIDQGQAGLARASRRMCLASVISPIHIVMDERIDFSRSPEELTTWADSIEHVRPLLGFRDRVPETELMGAIGNLYKEFGKAHHGAVVEAVETVKNVITSMTEQLLSQVPCVGLCKHSTVEALVRSAVQQLLHTTDDLGDDSEFNTIHVLHALRQEKHRKKIWGFVVQRLANQGEIPEICLAMRIEELQSNTEAPDDR